MYIIGYQYRKEWTYLSNITDIDDLRNSAVDGKLRTSRFRSIYWRILLDIMEPYSSQWLSCIEYHRNIFQDTSLEYLNYDKEDVPFENYIVCIFFQLSIFFYKRLTNLLLLFSILVYLETSSR